MKIVPVRLFLVVLVATITKSVCAELRESVVPADGLLDAVCLPSLTTVSGTYAPAEPICANTLIFNEEFNTFDMTLWEHEITMNGGGNGEFHWYDNDRRNTFVEDGKLIIRPTLTTNIISDLSVCNIVLDK